MFSIRRTYSILLHKMASIHKRESIGLVLGDLLVFVVSLWLTLVIRYAEVPSNAKFIDHFEPFIWLFLVWVLVFFIAGLYDKPILLQKRELIGGVLKAHLGNIIIALVVFYSVPQLGITPKVILFIYLLASSLLISLWRFVVYPRVTTGKKIQSALIGSGTEVQELYTKLNATPQANLHFVECVDPSTLKDAAELQAFKQRVKEHGISVLAVDLLHPDAEHLFRDFYDLMFSGVQFIDMHKLYEDLFDREPLGLIDESWFIEHISTAPNFIYDTLKRVMDIAVSLPLGLVSLIFYPFVWVAIKLDDKGPLFITQHRVGKGNKPIHIIKFRTMSVATDVDLTKDSVRRVTRVGAFLRKSRIDELPQLWNVIRGDLSLIGPRPELPALVATYEQEISYYAIRHLIKPGLSGWAQIYHENHPHHGLGVLETKEKLSYDLYYIKHRSFVLDIKIALKTIKALLSRTGI